MKSTSEYAILLVDDDLSVLNALNSLFSDQYEVLSAHSGPEAIALAEKNAPIAVVVMDIKMEGMDGFAAARKIRGLLPDTAVIFHTGYSGEFEERVIDSREKPFDYIEKGVSSIRLKRAVRNAVDSFSFKTGRKTTSESNDPNYGLIGNSAAIKKIIRDITLIAPTDNKVMILGETGTGKELVAKAIHNHGNRRNNRLVILNCNHKSPDLIESELFGHKKGSFTGAICDKLGYFEYAIGGTVFLDEIGDLDITSQAKLLRVVEYGEFNRIGDPETIKTDIRLLCATHKNLEQMVSSGTFRQDLYARLHGIPICLPPLRERREDIPLLVEYFAEKYIQSRKIAPKIFDSSAIDLFMQQEWHENVRGLLNAVEDILAYTDSDLIMASDVESYLKLSAQYLTRNACADGEGMIAKVESYKRALIVEALRKAKGNVSAAASILKYDKTNLRKYIKDNNISF